MAFPQHNSLKKNEDNHTRGGGGGGGETENESHIHIHMILPRCQR